MEVCVGAGSLPDVLDFRCNGLSRGGAGNKVKVLLKIHTLSSTSDFLDLNSQNIAESPIALLSGNPESPYFD